MYSVLLFYLYTFTFVMLNCQIVPFFTPGGIRVTQKASSFFFSFFSLFFRLFWIIITFFCLFCLLDCMCLRSSRMRLWMSDCSFAQHVWISTEVVTALFGCYMAGASWNCYHLGAISLYTIQPCTSLRCHLLWSHMRMMHVYLAVTCHLPPARPLAEWIFYVLQR